MSGNQSGKGRARGRPRAREVQTPVEEQQSPQLQAQVQRSSQRRAQRNPHSPLSPESPEYLAPSTSQQHSVPHTSQQHSLPHSSRQQQSAGRSARSMGHQPPERPPPPPQESREGRVDPSLIQVAGAFRAMSLANEPKPGQALRRGAMRGRFELTPPIKTRPEHLKIKQGIDGKEIDVISNHFRLMKKTDWSLYQYRVDFSPEEERTKIRKALLRDHKDRLGEAYMFDGTMLFTIQRMRPNEFEVFSVRDADQAKIRITIKLTNELAVGDFQYIQLYNIILRHCMDAMKFQLVGREYFDPSVSVRLTNYNLEIWPGYNNSINQYEYNIMMLIDVSHKVLRTDTVLDYMEGCKKRFGETWRGPFEKLILGNVVFTFYNNKPYRVDDIAFHLTPLDTFKKGNSDITYMDYYREKYQLRIDDTHQPLLISRPKARDIRGGRNQNVILIPELCHMTGLSDEMRTNFNLMKAVADKTRVGPAARINSYYKFMDRMNNSAEVQKKLGIWNFKFASGLEKIKARRLEPEPLYTNSAIDAKPIEHHDGDWTRLLRGRAMLSIGKLENWCVIINKFHCKDKTGKNVFHSFVTDLMKIARSMNFVMPQPEQIIINDDRFMTYVNALEKYFSRGKADLALCIINGGKPEVYTAIKKKCCIDRCVPSQVIATKTLTHKNLPSVLTKIVIQINCKLGGSPWYTPIPYKDLPTMVIGFDVCHDSKVKDKSVGAMVASLNYTFSSFYSAVSKHTLGEELSNDIATHVHHAVIRYQAVNEGNLPPRIIMYRDGVGESNVGYVLEHEVAAIQSRLNSNFTGNNIKFVFILVSKRIQTRIFLVDNGNVYNPQPGTIVDDVITSPEKYDFFLVSQSVRQGTVTPTNYHVIYDTLKCSANQAQRITYKMCHLYYNCSTTVRVPAQVQYAHKLAFLVGQVTIGTPGEGLSELLYFL